MEKVTINGKEYQLDIDKAKEQGLLKEGNDRVKSWEEFEEKYKGECGYRRFLSCEGIAWTIQSTAISEIGTQFTRRDAKALDAFSKLLKLRKDWIRGWEPDWKILEPRYCIVSIASRVEVQYMSLPLPSRALSFPTNEMAEEFLETFRGLLEEAKDLI